MKTTPHGSTLISPASRVAGALQHRPDDWKGAIEHLRTAPTPKGRSTNKVYLQAWGVMLSLLSRYRERINRPLAPTLQDARLILLLNALAVIPDTPLPGFPESWAWPNDDSEGLSRDWLISTLDTRSDGSLAAWKAMVDASCAVLDAREADWDSKVSDATSPGEAMAEPTDSLSISAAADIFGVAPKTIRQWIKACELPVYGAQRLPSEFECRRLLGAGVLPKRRRTGK